MKENKEAMIHFVRRFIVLNWNNFVSSCKSVKLVTMAVLMLACPLFGQTNLVTPTQYLASLPKPNFVKGALPRLQRFGWLCDSNTRVELAKDWDYTMDLGEADTWLASDLSTPGTTAYGLAALAKADPSTYALSIIVPRDFPTNAPKDIYCINSSGQFVNNTTNVWTDPNDPNNQKVISPEGPDSAWIFVTAYWSNLLNNVATKAPIKYILNQGEYGLDVCGDSTKGIWAWQHDYRVAAMCTNLNDAYHTPVLTNAGDYKKTWPDYISAKKAHQLSFLTAAIKNIFPNRVLSLFYRTDLEMHRQYFADWNPPYQDENYRWWGWDSLNMNSNTDLPDFECYFDGSKGWTNCSLLTDYLDEVGFDFKLGKTNNYTWVCSGFNRGDGTNDYSDMPHYMGFLKCLYVGGMVGCIPGMYDANLVQYSNILQAPFPSNSPPQWIQEVVAVSRVHALFSHNADFITNGDLLSGPQRHVNAQDQPAYEFTNTAADTNVRVLARKLRTADQYLVVAWASVGPDTNVTVNIPGLGDTTVNARASGSVYLATTNSLNLLDPNGLYPSQTYNSNPVSGQKTNASLTPPSMLRVLSTIGP